MHKLLVVEDDALQRQTLSNLLSPHYTTECCATGREALLTLPNLRPDLILTDITLPDLSGVDLLRHIRQDTHQCATPVVALSTTIHPGSLDIFRMLGFNDYLQKPIWDAAPLFEKVTPLLG